MWFLFSLCVLQLSAVFVGLIRRKLRTYLCILLLSGIYFGSVESKTRC